jgi:hypothetical protein
MTTGTLRSLLVRQHTSWRAEVAAALGPAQQTDAGPWARWSALRYLEGTFPARVTRERLMVESVATRLSEDERAHLWALGELLEVLPAYLSHLVGLCHRANDYADVTSRVLTVLDRWCRAAEDALGPLPVGALPAQLRPGLGADSSADSSADSKRLATAGV